MTSIVSVVLPLLVLAVSIPTLLLSFIVSIIANHCGLFGLKNGEPTLLLPFLANLAPGEADKTSRAFNTARQQWSARTGKK